MEKKQFKVGDSQKRLKTGGKKQTGGPNAKTSDENPHAVDTIDDILQNTPSLANLGDWCLMAGQPTIEDTEPPPVFSPPKDDAADSQKPRHPHDRLDATTRPQIHRQFYYRRSGSFRERPPRFFPQNGPYHGPTGSNAVQAQGPGDSSTTGGFTGPHHYPPPFHAERPRFDRPRSFHGRGNDVRSYVGGPGGRGYNYQGPPPPSFKILKHGEPINKEEKPQPKVSTTPADATKPPQAPPPPPQQQSQQQRAKIFGEAIPVDTTRRLLEAEERKRTEELRLRQAAVIVTPVNIVSDLITEDIPAGNEHHRNQNQRPASQKKPQQQQQHGRRQNSQQRDEKISGPAAGETQQPTTTPPPPLTFATSTTKKPDLQKSNQGNLKAGSNAGSSSTKATSIPEIGKGPPKQQQQQNSRQEQQSRSPKDHLQPVVPPPPPPPPQTSSADNNDLPSLASLTPAQAATVNNRQQHQQSSRGGGGAGVRSFNNRRNQRGGHGHHQEAPHETPLTGGVTAAAAVTAAMVVQNQNLPTQTQVPAPRNDVEVDQRSDSTRTGPPTRPPSSADEQQNRASRNSSYRNDNGNGNGHPPQGRDGGSSGRRPRYNGSGAATNGRNNYRPRGPPPQHVNPGNLPPPGIVTGGVPTGYHYPPPMQQGVPVASAQNVIYYNPGPLTRPPVQQLVYTTQQPQNFQNLMRGDVPRHQTAGGPHPATIVYQYPAPQQPLPPYEDYYGPHQQPAYVGIDQGQALQFANNQQPQPFVFQYAPPPAAGYSVVQGGPPPNAAYLPPQAARQPMPPQPYGNYGQQQQFRAVFVRPQMVPAGSQPYVSGQMHPQPQHMVYTTSSTTSTVLASSNEQIQPAVPVQQPVYYSQQMPMSGPPSMTMSQPSQVQLTGSDDGSYPPQQLQQPMEFYEEVEGQERQDEAQSPAETPSKLFASGLNPNAPAFVPSVPIVSLPPNFVPPGEVQLPADAMVLEAAEPFPTEQQPFVQSEVSLAVLPASDVQVKQVESSNDKRPENVGVEKPQQVKINADLPENPDQVVEQPTTTTVDKAVTTELETDASAAAEIEVKIVDGMKKIEIVEDTKPPVLTEIPAVVAPPENEPKPVKTPPKKSEEPKIQQVEPVVKKEPIARNYPTKKSVAPHSRQHKGALNKPQATFVITEPGFSDTGASTVAQSSPVVPQSAAPAPPQPATKPSKKKSKQKAAAKASDESVAATTPSTTTKKVEKVEEKVISAPVQSLVSVVVESKPASTTSAEDEEEDATSPTPTSTPREATAPAFRPSAPASGKKKAKQTLPKSKSSKKDEKCNFMEPAIPENENFDSRNLPENRQLDREIPNDSIPVVVLDDTDDLLVREDVAKSTTRGSSISHVVESTTKTSRRTKKPLQKSNDQSTVVSPTAGTDAGGAVANSGD